MTSTAKALSLVCCVLLAGCEPARVSVEADDPNLTTKLGITKSEWSAIQQLSVDREDLPISQVARLRTGEIDIEFLDSNVRDGEKSGPVDRYEKTDQGWKRDLNFSGHWVKVSLTK